MRPPSSLKKASTRRSLFCTLTLAATLAFNTPRAYTQGCAQCLDNTAATPPGTQAAYRHAIILLTVTAGGLFIGTLIFLRRQP